MTFTPRVQGDTETPLANTFTYDTGAPYVLTGFNVLTDFALHITNQARVTTLGLGTWQITNATLGQCLYFWNAADVANAGVFTIQASLTHGGKTKTFEAQTLVIEPKPVP